VCVQGGRDGEPAGTCASRCRPGGCDGARVCWDGLCLDPCLKLACAAHEVCNPEARRCEDWCDLIHDCPEGEHCYGGECGRCPAVPCGPGLVCAAAGRCRPDPCEDAPCTAIEACIEGECVASCASRSCPLFTTCVDGACVSDPCGGLTCGPGEGCVDGLCVESRCLGAAGCPDPAHVCIPGVGCRPDPCRGVRCPAAERCEPACPGRECRARCVADWEPGPAAEGEGEGPAEGEGEGPAEGEGEGEGEGPAPEGCAAGTLRSCRCDDGRAGLQECDEAGFGWAPCACADLPAPGPGPAEDESPAEDGCDCALTPPRAGSTLPLPLLLRR